MIYYVIGFPLLYSIQSNRVPRATCFSCTGPAGQEGRVALGTRMESHTTLHGLDRCVILCIYRSVNKCNVFFRDRSTSRLLIFNTAKRKQLQIFSGTLPLKVTNNLNSGQVKTNPGKWILRVTHLNGKCSQN